MLPLSSRLLPEFYSLRPGPLSSFLAKRGPRTPGDEDQELLPPGRTRCHLLGVSPQGEARGHALFLSPGAHPPGTALGD